MRKRYTTKTTTEKTTDIRLVVRDGHLIGPGEETRIMEVDLNNRHYKQQLESGALRIFDPIKDNRGPCVQIMNTYMNKESTWYPLTQGTYVVEFDPNKSVPKELKNHGLGFGTRSAPHSTLKSLHCAWKMLLKKCAHLVPYLRIVKVAAVFTTDHPKMPGGSFVIVDPAILPPAVDESRMDRTYC